jgi:hypothetical protein
MMNYWQFCKYESCKHCVKDTSLIIHKYTCLNPFDCCNVGLCSVPVGWFLANQRLSLAVSFPIITAVSQTTPTQPLVIPPLITRDQGSSVQPGASSSLEKSRYLRFYFWPNSGFGLKDLATKFWIQQFNAGLEECYSLFHCLLHLVEWTDLRWLIERNSRMSPQIMHTLYMYCALLVLTCVCECVYKFNLYWN